MSTEGAEGHAQEWPLEAITHLVAQRDTLAEALRVYADARHWGISRDDLDLKVVSWIGPGATEKPLPDAMRMAREALAEAGLEP